MSSIGRQGLWTLSAATLLYLTLSACTSTPTRTVTPIPLATSVLRTFPTTGALKPILTPSFIAPTPAHIGPTATPHTYSIQSGDTLITIATEHGVTVEALQLINAGIDPLTLQIGQKIIIPLVGADETTGYLPSPTPLPTSLTVFRCYPTPSRGQLCLGEAQNDNEHAVINLAVQVTVVMPNGDLGPSQVTFAPVEILMPGETVPIAARFANMDTVWGATARVIAAQDASELKERFLALTIGAVSSKISESGYYTVSTEVVNNTTQHANQIVLLISGYSAEGDLRGFRIIELKQDLQSGEKANVVATLTSAMQEIIHFSVSAHARARSP